MMFKDLKNNLENLVSDLKVDNKSSSTILLPSLMDERFKSFSYGVGGMKNNMIL